MAVSCSRQSSRTRAAVGKRLVHYTSPFAPAIWVPAWQAEIAFELDDRRYSRLVELEMVSDVQRAAGPPHIDHTDGAHESGTNREGA